ncbi:MAG: hypothetical protein ABIC40_05560 [bacterium]
MTQPSDDKPGESLDQLKKRVERLEKPNPTSQLYARFGWPITGIGVLIWIVQAFMPGNHFFLSILSLILIGLGASLVAVSFVSAHSEGVEKSEKERRIREKNKVSRCLYLEGNISEGKGSVGRCTLYEFDMVDYPYCVYCREYTATKGSPKM